MNLLNKLERTFGKFAIKGLMLYITTLNLVIYLLVMILQTDKVDKAASFLSFLYLSPQLVLDGQVWRLVTFLLIPEMDNPIFTLFTLCFYYFIGNGLESEWGAFKFNIYYLVGVIFTIAAAFLTGFPAFPLYLNLSLILAFAYIYPKYEIRLMFFIPIQMKYLGWLYCALLGYWYIKSFYPIRIAILASLVNFALFFGKDIILGYKNRGRSYVNKTKFSTQTERKGAFHRCTLCGRTELDDSSLDFRYCSSCEGDYEYCSDHLKDHDHIKKS